jgi:hypothetical protein
VLVAYLLLAAPVAAAALFWGSWGWLVASALVAVVEYASLKRSQRFSARLWRSLGFGGRSGRERATERIYVAFTVAGVALLVVAIIHSL